MSIPTFNPEAYAAACERAAERQGTARLCRIVDSSFEPVEEAYAEQTGGFCMVAVWEAPSGVTYAATYEGHPYVTMWRDRREWESGEHEPFEVLKFRGWKHFKKWCKASRAERRARMAIVDAVADVVNAPVADRAEFLAACERLTQARTRHEVADAYLMKHTPDSSL